MTGEGRISAILCGLASALFLAGSGSIPAQALPTLQAQEMARGAQSVPNPGAAEPQAPPEPSGPSYPQTADGFKAQMNAAVEAYKAGDAARGRRMLEQFRLPHSDTWFAQQFGAEQGGELAQRYDRLFEIYLKTMDNDLQDFITVKHRKLIMSLKPGPQDPPQVHSIPGVPAMKPSGIVPATKPDCFNGLIEIPLTGKADLLLKGHYKVVLLERTFLYREGAFRFIGLGSQPFWVWEETPLERTHDSGCVAVPVGQPAETPGKFIIPEIDEMETGGGNPVHSSYGTQAILRRDDPFAGLCGSGTEG
jgi:hypothetical protein